jgi:hypothetical protein
VRRQSCLSQSRREEGSRSGSSWVAAITRIQVARVPGRAAGSRARFLHGRERGEASRGVRVSCAHGGNERRRHRPCSVRAPGVPRVLGKHVCARHEQMPQVQSADPARRTAGIAPRPAEALLALLRAGPATCPCANNNRPYITGSAYAPTRRRDPPRGCCERRHEDGAGAGEERHQPQHCHH